MKIQVDLPKKTLKGLDRADRMAVESNMRRVLGDVIMKTLKADKMDEQLMLSNTITSTVDTLTKNAHYVVTYVMSIDTEQDIIHLDVEVTEGE